MTPEHWRQADCLLDKAASQLAVTRRDIDSAIRGRNIDPHHAVAGMIDTLTALFNAIPVTFEPAE